MENRKYVVNFFVIDNTGEEIDNDSITIEAVNERKARTETMIFLQKNYKGNRWEIESITLAE